LGTTTGHETEQNSDSYESGLDFKNAFYSAEHSCLWAILRRLTVPDVNFLEAICSNSWMKMQVGSESTASIQLDTGTVQGFVLYPLLFDLLLNALLRLQDSTGITHYQSHSVTLICVDRDSYQCVRVCCFVLLT